MPVATRVILEMYGLIALPASVVVPFPVKVAHPKRCQRAVSARMAALTRRGDLPAFAEHRAQLAKCDACRACFG